MSHSILLLDPPIQGSGRRSRLYGYLCSVVFTALGLFGGKANASPPVFPDRDYVQVSRDGHLELDGKRVRFWGWIGHFSLEGDLARYKLKHRDRPAVRREKIRKTYEIYDALAKRIHDLGFNLVRIWNECNWDKPYKAGDGSKADMLAFSINALNKRGIKVWVTGFNDMGTVLPENVDVIDDPATAEEWKAAAFGLSHPALRGSVQIAWDPRSSALALQRMKQVADWPNHYKGGLRLGDDPQAAVWELSNEEWWFALMVRGDWQELPKFFRDQLQARWMTFLRTKYKDDAALKKAWQFTLPGESLSAGNVLLAPIASPSSGKVVNDANPAAIAALTVGQQAFTRDDFTRARAADVLEFFVGMQVAYKTKFRDEVKTWGRSLALCPLLLDTGDGFRIQSVYLHQQGDAVAMCSYLWQAALDRQQPRFPFVSGLEEPPRLAMGIPWLEVGRVPGKPFFVYEFQTNNPDKYRAEVPFRIATLGLIQDWDIISFHLFGRPNDPAERAPYDKPLHLATVKEAVEGVHFKNDLVESASMKTAGAMFINGLVQPVAEPTVMTFGRRSLYDPVSADYGKSFGDLGSKIAPTAWRYGLQMKVDPSKEADVVVGRTAERGLMEANPVRPTDEIEFDWMKGHLQIDSPSAAVYAGFFAKHGGPVSFRESGIVIDDVRIANQEGLNYPVGPDELYVAFAAVAGDGKPLAQSRKVTVTFVSSSMNYGFKLDHAKVARGDLGYTGKPFEGQTPGGNIPGKPPVAYAVPAGTLTAPAWNGMKYRVLDWHMRQIASGAITDGILRLSNERPFFLIELTR